MGCGWPACASNPLDFLEACACRSFPLVHGARADGAWLAAADLGSLENWVVGLDRTCLLYLSASLPSNNRHLEREAKKKEREISPLDTPILLFTWSSFNSLRLRFLNYLVASISDPRRSCRYDSPIRRRTRVPVSRLSRKLPNPIVSPSSTAEIPTTPRLVSLCLDVDSGGICALLLGLEVRL